MWEVKLSRKRQNDTTDIASIGDRPTLETFRSSQ
jgi:hypothetical protein